MVSRHYLVQQKERKVTHGVQVQHKQEQMCYLFCYPIRFWEEALESELLRCEEFLIVVQLKLTSWSNGTQNRNHGALNIERQDSQTNS